MLKQFAASTVFNSSQLTGVATGAPLLLRVE
jgi:hypothetical protein